MTRTVYVAFNTEKKDTQEFLTEEARSEFLLDNLNFEVRQYEQEIVEKMQALPNWTGFKNAIFDANFPLVVKCLYCNAYILVADMIVSSEAGATVYESNFLLAFQLLQSQLSEKKTPFLQTEIDFINKNLKDFNFSIQL